MNARPETHRGDLIRQRFKKFRHGRHVLLAALGAAVGVVAVRQVATARQVQTHDAVMRAQQGRVDGEVGRAAYQLPEMQIK